MKTIHKHLRRNLNDSRAGSNGVVVDGILAAGQDSVGLAGEASGDRNLEAAIDRSGVGKDGASDGNKGSVDLGVAVGALELVARGLEDNLVAGLDGRLGVGRDSDGREGLNGQLGVALGARGDEARGQGVDLVVREGSIERLGEGLLVQAGADVGGVARLNGQDRASGREVGLGHDVGGGTEVGGNTNTLEDGSGGQEGLDILVAKLVSAGSDGLGTSG